MGTGICPSNSRDGLSICLSASPVPTLFRLFAFYKFPLFALFFFYVFFATITIAHATFTNVRELIGVNRSSVQWGDFDSDSDLDLAVAGLDGSGTNRLIIYRYDGNNTFTNIAEPMGNSIGVYDASIQWGDCDNDGDLDLAVTGYRATGPSSNKAFIFRNDGSNNFTSLPDLYGSGGVSSSSIQWGDYDKDNDLDLIVSGWRSSTCVTDIFRNNGNNSFTKILSLTPTEQGSLHWGDFDNDGDLDLVVSGNDNANRHLIIYKNNGGGNFVIFATPMGINTGVDISSAHWGDYDNDGYLDLVVAGRDSNSKYRLIIFHNNNGNNFTSTVEPLGVNKGLSYASVQWGDYDNDGDLDFVATGEYGWNDNRSIIFQNDGNNIFTNVYNVGEGGSAQWGDYDNDGDLDLVISGSTSISSSTRLTVYQNDGNSNNYIKIKALTDANGNSIESDNDPDRPAIGAKVEIDLDGGVDFDTGPGKYIMEFATAISPVLVGVASATNVDIRVTFLDGDVVIKSVPVNQTITIKDPPSTLTDTFSWPHVLNTADSYTEKVRVSGGTTTYERSTVFMPGDQIRWSIPVYNPPVAAFWAKVEVQIDNQVSACTGPVLISTKDTYIFKTLPVTLANGAGYHTAKVVVYTETTSGNSATFVKTYVETAAVNVVDIAVASAGNGKDTITWATGNGAYILAFFRQSSAVPWSAAPEIRARAVYGNISDTLDKMEKDDGILVWNSKIITYADADKTTPIINYNNSVQVKIVEYDTNNNLVATHVSDFFTADNQPYGKRLIWLVHGTHCVAADMEKLRKGIADRILTTNDIWSFEYPSSQSWDKSAKLLEEAIKAFRVKNFPSTPITLITHSLGGPMARWYLEKYDPDDPTKSLYIAESVDKIIQLAPTNRGSWPADFMYHLNHDVDAVTHRYRDVYNRLPLANRLAVDAFGDYHNDNDEAVFNQIYPPHFQQHYPGNLNLVGKLNNYDENSQAFHEALNPNVEYGIIAGTLSLNSFIKPIGPALYLLNSMLITAPIIQYFPVELDPGQENDIFVRVNETWIGDANGNVQFVPVGTHHGGFIGAPDNILGFPQVIPEQVFNTIYNWLFNPIRRIQTIAKLLQLQTGSVASSGSTRVATPDGIAATVPASAVPASSTCEIGALAPDNPKMTAFNNAVAQTAKKPVYAMGVYDFSIKDQSGNVQTGNFSTPVRIEIPYVDADNDGIVDGTRYAASSLKLSYLNESTQQLVQVSSTADATNKTVWANVSHFSIYVIVSDSNTISDTALSVKIEGRGDDRSGINIAVYSAGGDTQSEGYTDSSGAFELQAISDGSYTIKIKESRTLRMSGTMTIAGGKITNFTFSRTTLKGGDANNDNYVTDADYSILAPAWMTQSGNSKYDARADFNNDGYITDADYSVLAPNWMKSGDQ